VKNLSLFIQRDRQIVRVYIQKILCGRNFRHYGIITCYKKFYTVMYMLENIAAKFSFVLKQLSEKGQRNSFEKKINILIYPLFWPSLYLLDIL